MSDNNISYSSQPGTQIYISSARRKGRALMVKNFHTYLIMKRDTEVLSIGTGRKGCMKSDAIIYHRIFPKTGTSSLIIKSNHVGCVIPCNDRHKQQCPTLKRSSTFTMGK